MSSFLFLLTFVTVNICWYYHSDGGLQLAEIEDHTDHSLLGKNQSKFLNGNNISQAEEWKDLVYESFYVEGKTSRIGVNIKGKTLSSQCQKWIRSYMILIKQDYPLCWHNASMQFLFSPEIVNGEEDYFRCFGHKYPEKIKKMIKVMREILAKQIKNKDLEMGDYFFGNKIPKEIDRSVREVPDGREGLIRDEQQDGGVFIFRKVAGLDGRDRDYFLNSDECNYGKFNGINFIDEIINIDEYDEGCYVSPQPNMGCLTIDDIVRKMQFVKDNKRSFMMEYNIRYLDAWRDKFWNLYDQGALLNNLNNALCVPSRHGYYPSLISFKSTYPFAHWFNFVITYDKNYQIENVFCVDGCNEGFEVLDFKELYETISKGSVNLSNGSKREGSLCVFYSPLKEIRKWYIPFLMF